MLLFNGNITLKSIDIARRSPLCRGPLLPLLTKDKSCYIGNGSIKTPKSPSWLILLPTTHHAKAIRFKQGMFYHFWRSFITPHYPETGRNATKTEINIDFVDLVVMIGNSLFNLVKTNTENILLRCI